MSRTIKVLGALVAGITVVSGVLLALEPGPTFRLSNVRFSAFDADAGLSGPEAVLFDTAPSRQWQAIVIRDSRGVEGGQEELNGHFQRNGIHAGADYHFVVRRDGVGRIEVGERWRSQSAGGVSVFGGPTGEAWNQNTIDICLVGDADKKAFDQAQLQELVWLVRQQQARYRIPADRVVVQVGGKPGVAVGRMFPLNAFMAQLAK